MTTTLETTRRIPRTANAGGVVKSWTVEPGTVVETGQELGIFDRDDLGEEQVTAPCSGIVGKGVAVGARVEAGGRLVYVEPTTTAPEGLYEFEVQRDAPQRRASQSQRGTAREPSAQASGADASNRASTPASTVASDTASKQEATSPATSGKPSKLEPPAKRRRATPGLEEITIGLVDEEPEKKPARPRTSHATYHLTTDQAARIKKQALLLKLDGEELSDISESEIVRAAVEALLELDRPYLLATLEKNRRREIKGKYGAGWPRPSRNKRRR
jgi:pyruvate/2-oxoglutarate dehydrogenase complex dihydrolipoamide acyltransferase (E2) component